MISNRCIIIKDPHFRLSVPMSRTKTFFEDVNAKIDFIISYCESQNISDIIFTGDIIDEKNQNRYDFNEYKLIVDIFNRFKSKQINAYSVCGNHDAIDGSFKSSIYADLIDRRLVTDVSVQYGRSVRVNNTNIIVVGVSHCYDIDKFKQYIAEINSNYDNSKIVCVIHQNVIPNAETFSEQFFDTVNYTELASLSKKISVWVCGHYHKGFPITEVHGKTFINPYNMIRLSKSPYLEVHTPEFVVADFVNEIYETVQIPHKAYSDVFTVEADTILQIKEQVNLDFMGDIKNLTSNFNKSDVSISDDIKSLVDYYLSKATEELQ